MHYLLIYPLVLGSGREFHLILVFVVVSISFTYGKQLIFVHLWQIKFVSFYLNANHF